MLFHLSAATVLLAIAVGECKAIMRDLTRKSMFSPALTGGHQRSSAWLIIQVLVYYRNRLLPLLSPYLPSSLVARISNYRPLDSFSFTDQAAAGMSSGNFDLEENMAEGSGEGRVGLDEAGVEEVRRIM